jgi:hypothetical protein
MKNEKNIWFIYMKRRSNKIDMNIIIICILFFIILLMFFYILGRTNKKQTSSSTSVEQSIYTPPEIVTSAYIDNYDFYNFMPRRLFRNFYESDYYDYRERPVVIQDTKPIYINVPQQTLTQSSQSSQPAQQNNLNLYNYPQPINIPTAPSISPPPLSGVSSSTLSEPDNIEN